MINLIHIVGFILDFTSYYYKSINIKHNTDSTTAQT